MKEKILMLTSIEKPDIREKQFYQVNLTKKGKMQGEAIDIIDNYQRLDYSQSEQYSFKDILLKLYHVAKSSLEKENHEYKSEMSKQHIDAGLKNIYKTLKTNTFKEGFPKNPEERKQIYDKFSKGYTFIAKSIESSVKDKKMDAEQVIAAVDAFGDAGHNCSGRWTELLEKMTSGLPENELNKLSIDLNLVTEKKNPLLKIFSNSRDVILNKLANEYAEKYYSDLGVAYATHYEGYFKRYLNEKHGIRGTSVIKSDSYVEEGVQKEISAEELLSRNDIEGQIIEHAKNELRKSELSPSLINSIYDSAKAVFRKQCEEKYNSLSQSEKDQYGSSTKYMEQHVTDYITTNIFEYDEETYEVKSLKEDAIDIYIEANKFTEKKPITSQKEMEEFIKHKIINDKIDEVIEIIDSVRLEEETVNNILFTAASENKLELVKFLKEHGANINHSDREKNPLLGATNFDATETVNYLLENSATTNISNGEDITPLMLAAYNGNLEILKNLLNHDANENIKDKNGDVALNYAISQNHPQIVRSLIEKNANLEVANQEKETPLLFAASYGQEEIVKLLIEEYEKMDTKNNSKSSHLYRQVNARSKSGDTPLIAGIFSSNTNVVGQLLDAGADANTTCANGLTALCHAAESENPNMTKVILAKKDNISLNSMTKVDSADFFDFSKLDKDYSNIDSINVASPEKLKSYQEGIMSYICAIASNNIEAIGELLKANHKKIYIPKDVKQIGLISAIRENDVDVITKMVENGVSMKLPPIPEGIPPFKYALKIGALNSLKAMTDGGFKLDNSILFDFAKIKFRDPRRQVKFTNFFENKGLDLNHIAGGKKDTLLIHAIKSNNMGLASILIEKGVELNIKNADGKTALDVAGDMNYRTICHNLKEKGAKFGQEIEKRREPRRKHRSNGRKNPRNF
jgi:ankyrin repeat protein